MTNVFDDRAKAEEYAKKAGPDYEIVQWTNKKMQKMFSVIRKRKGRKGRF